MIAREHSPVNSEVAASARNFALPPKRRLSWLARCVVMRDVVEVTKRQDWFSCSTTSALVPEADDVLTARRTWGV